MEIKERLVLMDGRINNINMTVNLNHKQMQNWLND